MKSYENLSTSETPGIR